MRPASPLYALAALLAATACANRNAVPLGADFGNAVEQNTARQVVDPQPVTARYGAPELDGKRAKVVIDRYETGTVIAPETIETTTFGQNR
ncbi:MAG: hypothetical protein ACE5GS_00540 [Kiloniellaceae bacterium]